jgi:hypothetical protein
LKRKLDLLKTFYYRVKVISLVVVN